MVFILEDWSEEKDKDMVVLNGKQGVDTQGNSTMI
jgi:hypothetical protein